MNQAQFRTVMKQFSDLNSYLSTFQCVVNFIIGQMSPFSSKKIKFIPWDVTVPLPRHFHAFITENMGEKIHK